MLEYGALSSEPTPFPLFTVLGKSPLVNVVDHDAVQPRAEGEPNRNLAFAKEHMTDQQILEAERRVKKWKIRHHDQQD